MWPAQMELFQGSATGSMCPLRLASRASQRILLTLAKANTTVGEQGLMMDVQQSPEVPRKEKSHWLDQQVPPDIE